MRTKQYSEVIDQTISFYDHNADEYFRETVAIDMSEIYDQFLNLLPSGGKILDAGCGSGRDSLHFLQKGFEVTAFDASAEMVRKASELTKLDVRQMRFKDVHWVEEFNGIWASASLLHLPMRELGSVFEVLINALKTSGVMYASFKEGEGEKIENGRFFSYYGETELKNILQNVGSNKVLKSWIRNDKRKNQQQNWINLLVKRN